MNTDKIKSFRYSQLDSEVGRNARLVNCPGLYAWYRDLDLRMYANDEGRFLKKVRKVFDADLSAKFEGKVGTYYKVTVVEKSGYLPEEKQNLFNDLSTTCGGRNYLIKAIKSLSVFLPPLYIGQSSNIQNRLTEHIIGRSLLRERLSEGGIKLEECSVKIMYLDSNKADTFSELLEDKYQSKDLLLLFEDLVTRLASAAYVRRPG